MKRETPNDEDPLGILKTFGIFLLGCVGIWLIYPVADQAMKSSHSPAHAVVSVFKSVRGLAGVLILIAPTIFRLVHKGNFRKWFKRFE